eukprot:TRINITY_DN69690_c0_g1_i1.p1 TRINITY_DN69690_c0_g1~~TRINITY_DN69690_c0_g1_i1.p1  ORF type:complete len:387 (+),score=55.51 TRINITY_DN69690_c0_g1_i1:89-1162(+)
MPHGSAHAKVATRRGQGSASPSPSAANRRTGGAKASRSAVSPVSNRKGTETQNVPRHLAARSPWSPEHAPLPTSKDTPALEGIGQDLLTVVAELGTNDAALSSLVGELQRGGHDAIDIAVEQGALQRTVALLNGGETQDLTVARGVTDALWWLAADSDQTQLLIGCGGHDAVLRLVREHGPHDASVATSSFRLLSNTLYCEKKNSDLFCRVDFSFVIDALRWAIECDMAQNENCGLLLRHVCDVAALWVQRSSGGGEDVAKSMVSIIPVLLERMASRADDAELLMNGCRLLYIIARSGGNWPDSLRTPAEVALKQLALMLQFGESFEAKAYSSLALEAVSAMPSGASQSERNLSQMD